jgi:membrane carboxypeptidase/penicillin-binding protein
MKPLVYLAALRAGFRLDTLVPDEPIAVATGSEPGLKWIANYDDRFKGPIPMRQALAESRNAVAVWLTQRVGLDKVRRLARELGIRTPLQPYVTTALGASEVNLLELAGAYRALASGLLAEPHIVARVTDPLGVELYVAPSPLRQVDPEGLREIQEGLRGVVRLPNGTAHSLDDLAIPIMGKTGTTSGFRDALFVGSTYGPLGITVAVRIGFDDNRSLGERETGGRAALPIFRDIVLRAYEDGIAGEVPKFPRETEEGIDEYLFVQAALAASPERVSSGSLGRRPVAASKAEDQRLFARWAKGTQASHLAASQSCGYASFRSWSALTLASPVVSQATRSATLRSPAAS